MPYGKLLVDCELRARDLGRTHSRSNEAFPNLGWEARRSCKSACRLLVFNSKLIKVEPETMKFDKRGKIITENALLITLGRGKEEMNGGLQSLGRFHLADCNRCKQREIVGMA